MVSEKKCHNCHLVLPLARFSKAKGYVGGVKSHCRDCDTTKQREYRQANREKMRGYYKKHRAANLERIHEYERRHRLANVEKRNAACRLWSRQVKIDAVNAYGGHCKCCGETEIGFLTIDHIFSDGHKERDRANKQNVYSQLKKRGYPQGRYQVLCWNCNCGRAHNGGICPHEESRLRLVKSA